MTWMEKHRLCPKMLKDERLNLATWGYLEKNCKRHFRYVDLYMRSPTKKLHVLDQLNATNNCILIKPKESPAWGLFDNAGPVLYEIFNEPFGYSDPQEWLGIRFVTSWMYALSAKGPHWSKVQANHFVSRKSDPGNMHPQVYNHPWFNSSSCQDCPIFFRGSIHIYSMVCPWFNLAGFPTNQSPRYLHDMLQVIHLAQLPLERCILDGCGYADNVQAESMCIHWFLGYIYINHQKDRYLK